MLKKLNVFVFTALLTANISMVNAAAVAEKAVPASAYKEVAPLELVAKPADYLNKKIKINGTFDKFSTLGLDYKPAFRDSKKYISLLIRRPDVSNVIPLSEMKIVIQREKAEKLLDLESGDKIELTGSVFSSALNDPWVEVDSVKILSVKQKKTN
ncbi:MAG: hypothetical protein WCK67_08265 [bacterium]